MADVFSREERSRIMARVRGKNTKPEMVVRSLLHRMGYRFRIHRRDLPGVPDIVLPRYRKIIFVHGCFWHGHAGCVKSTRPTTNADFWNAKLDRTIERDKADMEKLSDKGWEVLVVWECEIKQLEQLELRLRRFITSDYPDTGNGR